MKVKYSSSSQQKYKDFIGIVVFLLLINFFFLTANDINLYIFTLSIVISIFFGFIAYKKLYKKAFYVMFYENRIEVKYDNIIKTETINYSDIIVYKYSATYSSKTPHSNYLILKDYKFCFSPVAKNKDFIVFCKWLKSKNDSIKIEISPSDNYLNHLYQEEFGFNYRKR